MIWNVTEYVLPNSENPHFMNHAEFSDLVRYLNIPKNQVELLGFRLQEWNILEKEAQNGLFIVTLKRTCKLVFPEW
jgi:hypothetical protein